MLPYHLMKGRKACGRLVVCLWLLGPVRDEEAYPERLACSSDFPSATLTSASRSAWLGFGGPCSATRKLDNRPPFSAQVGAG